MLWKVYKRERAFRFLACSYPSQSSNYVPIKPATESQFYTPDVEPCRFRLKKENPIVKLIIYVVYGLLILSQSRVHSHPERWYFYLER